MLNIYNRFVMQPPSRVSVASRLLPRNAQTAVDVQTPPVSSFFMKNYGARTLFTAPGAAYAMGQGGNGGFSGLSGFGDIPLVDGVVFTNHDAADDFIRGVPASNWRDGGGSWDGVSQVILSNFNNALVRAKNSGVRGSVASDSILARTKALVQRLTSLQGFGIGGRSASQDQQYRGAMVELKRLMQSGPAQLNTAAAADEAEMSAGYTSSTASTGSTGLPGYQTGLPGVVNNAVLEAAARARAAANSAAGGGSSGSFVEEHGSKLAVLAGVLAVGGIGFAIYKKRKKS